MTELGQEKILEPDLENPEPHYEETTQADHTYEVTGYKEFHFISGYYGYFSFEANNSFRVLVLGYTFHFISV